MLHTPKCDRFHKESRIIFHIIIYKVINASQFPPAFSSLLYGTKGNGQISLRNNTKNLEVHTIQRSGFLKSLKKPVLLPASIRRRQLWSTRRPYRQLHLGTSAMLQSRGKGGELAKRLCSLLAELASLKLPPDR